MAKARTATPLAPSKAAGELTRRYVDTLRRLQSSVQRSVEGATRGLTAAPEQVQTKARNDAIELINAYIETLRESLGHNDATQRIELGIRNYVLGLQRIAEEAQKEVAEAVREYASSMRDLPTEVRQGIEEAYTDYTSSLEEKLGQVDLKGISPDGLLALGQSMTTVALYTRAALGK